MSLLLRKSEDCFIHGVQVEGFFSENIIIV
jgi:hypothetical protein